MWMVPRRLSRSTSSCFLSSSNLEIISPCPPRQALSDLKRRRINAFFLPNSDQKIQMALRFSKILTGEVDEYQRNCCLWPLFHFAAFYIFQHTIWFLEQYNHTTLISLINVEPTITDFEEFHPPQKKSTLHVY